MVADAVVARKLMSRTLPKLGNYNVADITGAP